MFKIEKCDFSGIGKFCENNLVKLFDSPEVFTLKKSYLSNLSFSCVNPRTIKK